MSDYKQRMAAIEVGKYSRLYYCLILRDLLLGIKKEEISGKFKIIVAEIQSLISKTSMFASKVAQMAKTLNWWSIYNLLTATRDKMMLETPEDISELLDLKLLEPNEARSLYEEGIINIQILAHTNPTFVYKIMQRSFSIEFYSTKENRGRLMPLTFADAEEVVKRAQTINRRLKKMKKKKAPSS